MRMNRKIVIVVGSTLALAAAGAGVAFGTDDDATERPITGSAHDRASAAALEHTGGGEVTGTEVGDEESYYEVEVTTDGGQTDVQLDRDFNVVSSEGDDDSGEDD